MANIFVDGEELATGKDIASINSKIKIDAPMFLQVDNDDALNQSLGDIKGTGTSDLGTRLRFIRTAYENGKEISANYGGGMQFGMNGMVGMINLNALKPGAQIGVSINGKNFNWSKELAFKSDIDALQSQINDLKKQIGGVTSPAIYRFLPRLEAVA
ncbi:MAG: hypothetical protein ACLUDD_04830 [Lactobacillus kalixensis]|uniref:hypothetical protein n=1 Tax=Lactobacillus kalixensis TaxID=227944 RepID=UPI0039955ED5